VRLLVIATLLCALGTAGCGRGGDRADVRAIAERFVAAYERDQGPAACAALSGPARLALEREEQKACAAAVGGVDLDGGRVTAVEVYTTNAKVDFSSGESAFFSEEAAGWRLSAAGCRPQGKPADRPFECELEA